MLDNKNNIKKCIPKDFFAHSLLLLTSLVKKKALKSIEYIKVKTKRKNNGKIYSLYNG